MIGHFTQADTIIPEPGKASAFDRYAYSNNNPIKYSDPSGHKPCDDVDKNGKCITKTKNWWKPPKEPTKIIQVDIEKHEPKKQYDLDILDRFGSMACGIVAGANGGADFEKVGKTAEDHGYNPSDGIQPEELLEAYKDVYGDDNVTGGDNNNINDVFNNLLVGNIVIVDILVNEGTITPSTQKENYAHFARVLGIDKTKEIVYIENTLPGSPYWEVPFNEFEKVWTYPEKNASKKPDIVSTKATFWAAFIAKK